MSHYNNKGMASDLSLGRPTSGGDTNNIAASAAARQHTYNLQQAREQKKFADDAESNIGGLECYVRALQCERDKLAAFRRELPICMGLLDDAIQASREKLTKAVASSRMVACQASYSNYGNPTYNIAGGVHSTQPSEVQARRYSWESACIKPEAHASDHEQQQPSSSFKESNIMNMSTATQSNMRMFAHAPPHLAVPSHLHLVNYAQPSPNTSNMFLNKLQQKEGALFNQESAQLEMMRQSTKIEGFRTHEFSSSHNQEDEHIMTAREVREYEGLPEEDVHREEGASPRVMISNMSNNNMNSPGAGIMTSQTPRKARRCWSPELHQLFLHALHQLGGPQLATPKQIRELMHVEGLTNDEVKSHLQKFRLHTRRPAPIQVSEPAQQPHHLVLFGGIWVPTSAAESAPAGQLAASQLAGGGHATPSGNHNPYVPFHHLINGHNPMQSLMDATSSDQLDVHAGMETASEVDVARSDQSTSQNGGFDNTLHEDEDTEIHLGSKPIVSRVEITSPIAKARYQ